jgi:hypothetical protein
MGTRMIATVAVIGGLAWAATSVISTPDSVGQTKPQAAAGPPVDMPKYPVAVELILGVKDAEQTSWQGSVRVSQGRVIDIEVISASRDSSAEGSSFTVRSTRGPAAKKKQASAPAKKKKKQQKKVTAEQQPIVPAVVLVTLDAPSEASMTVTTNRGEISFVLRDLAPGTTKTLLDGQATARRLEASIRLTGRSTEDDYPALAKGKDGSIWLAYVEYTPGRPIDIQQAQARNFDSLESTNNGDRILLRRFDGKTWSAPIAVTDARRDVWRPTVAVDGRGSVIVAWAQPINDDWEILYRRFEPADAPSGPGSWSDEVQVTRTPGSDFNVVSATDATGVVWLAWQAWRTDNFDILAAPVTSSDKTPRLISNSDANDWSPAIAADGKGNVFVAWDTYAAGNYDVRLRIIGEKPRAIPVADTLRFEGRATLACDANNRLWIAYELGDEQWGKDYSTNQFERIGLKNNPGFALYINRTVAVKCLVGDELMTSAASLDAGFSDVLRRNKSVPRLVPDDLGGIWLLLRHHPLAEGGGEVWHSYALRYSGGEWSAPRTLSRSANVLDHRPGAVAHRDGILVAYAGDARTSTQNRDQADVYAAYLSAEKASVPQLKPDVSERRESVAAVHEDEPADVARMRGFTVNYGGKRLRLLRGEFHRHTEYTSHRDGDGLLEDSWRYALDAAKLDWMGNGDHLNGYGHEFMWWQVQKVTDLFQNPPHFIAAHTYERSVVYPSGHRNVMFPRRGIRPLPILEGNELRFGSAEAGAPDVQMLYGYLKRFGGICAVHTSATSMGTDWRDNDPDVEPIVEIYQGHRHNYEHFGAPRAPTQETNIGGYEQAGFVWHALKRQYRLGFQASSDHISTHMSYAVVLTDDVSRQGVIDGFKRRHCYAATDNIVLVVRSDDHLMGEAFTTNKPPALDIEVHAPRHIAKVHVICNNEYVYSNEPNRQDVSLRYTDLAAKPGSTGYYYVRVEQSDGNLAWASPMWITYQSAAP